MRIGLVCPYSLSVSGGVQSHVLGLAGWLTTRGHDVHVLAPGRPDADALTRTCLSADRVGSTGFSLPIRYNGSVARVAFGAHSALSVRSWLAGVAPDLVHVHEPLAPSASWWALAQTRTPLVATFHTATPDSVPLRVAARATARLLTRVDQAISVSWAAHDVALDYEHVPSAVIGNGVWLGPEPAATAPGRWRAGDHPRVTFIGRFHERRKGFPVLLRALPEIRRRHPDLEVCVVGHGAPIPVDGVRYLGELPDPERDALLARSDVCVVPNTGRESFGIVLVEALAAGAPVVASDLSAFYEVISDDHGPAGRLFPVGDHRALAAEVLASLGEPRDLNLTRGRAVAARFDWSRIGPAVEQQYRLAISARDLAPTRGPAQIP